MPGEQPRQAPPPTMTRDLQPCQAAGGTGGSSQPPGEDGAPASRPTKATGNGAQAVEPPETRPWQAGDVEPKAPLLRTQSLSSLPGKGGSPRAPPGRGYAQALPQQASRADGSPQQLYTLSISGSRARPTLDKTPEGPRVEDPGPPEAKAPPTPEELSFQRCFQETPPSFTSTDYTSPNATSGLPPLRAPPGSNARPCRPATYSRFQASRADAWPPTVENSFPGARFGVPAAKPEPFPEGGSPRVASFQYPFLALHGAGPKPFPEDAERALGFAFRQPRGAWPEEAGGTGTAYPLPALPAPQPSPCYPGHPTLDPPGDLGCAPAQPGAAHPAPSPFSESTATFPDSLHKSLTKALPERPPSAHDDTLGSPRGPPNSLPQRHFPGQAYGSPGASGVGTSPGSLDTELATPGPLATRLPQLWDPATAPYPTPPLGPPATTRSAFFEGQPSLDPHLGLPRSPPLPWPQVLPATGPGPHRMEVLSRLPFPPGAPEWQRGGQGALGTAGKTPGPGEKLAVLRNSPGQHGGSSPGLFAYNGLKDPGAQPLFYGVAQSQVSPRATPGLPPPRVVGASPCESPLPSPATNTASSSSCSSLSPLSSSPANPSPEESQLPGPLGPSTFFHPATRPQETSSPYPSPEPPHAIPMHYPPEPVRAFPFPAEGLGAEGAFKCLEQAPFPGSGPKVDSGGLEDFPQEPPPYPTHHFPLSSASLDQLDVLLTCRQCDQNYSSLAAFLGHRQFCSALLAKTKDGHPQPPGLPGPPTTPKAPASGNPSPLSHTKTVPFLLGGDLRAEGKDDPLRTSFLPGLAAAPFPLPATELDPEDDAKLDSLITEALNGLGYQSDNPEIDSSFIDVFADEEPSGPRGPGAGQPPKTRVGTMPENRAQPPLPGEAAPPEPQGPRPGNGGCLARSRPKTRSLGPAPAQADGVGLASQQRRGKRLTLYQKELDTPSTTRSQRGPKAPCLRPRRKGHGADPTPPRPRDLRTQTPKSHADHARQALPVETRSSRRLRLSPGKDSRRRKLRGSTWSKELIHKIVQQKNKRHKRQVRCGQGGRLSLVPPRPLPGSAEDQSLGEHPCASESEEEDGSRPQGSRSRGRPRQGYGRWRRGAKQEVDMTLGPQEDGGQQRPREVVRQEATTVRGSPDPEENRPALDSSQETQNPKTAEELPPDATEPPRGAPGPSPASRGESPRPPAPEQPAPARNDHHVSRGGSPAPGVDSLPGASACTEPAISPHGEDPPAYPAGELLVPVPPAADPTYLESAVLFLKSPDLCCGPALFNGDFLEDPMAKKGPQPYSSPHSKLFLGPKDLPGCFQEDLYSKPLALDTPPTSSMHPLKDGVGTDSLEPKPPRNPPYTIHASPSKAESPLTLESTPLFSGLTMDRFDPPIYSSLPGSEGTHSSLVCANPPPRKPQLEPPYSPFLPDKGWSLLEESPVLASHMGHLPDLLGEKAFCRRCPGEGAGATSPPSLPGKVGECGIAFMGNLSEDELEIKRLVAELESQLQSKGVHDTPELLCAAGHAGRTHTGTDAPLPTHQAASPPRDSFPEADLTGLGESTPHPEGAEAAAATTARASRSTQEEWPSPHPGETSPSPHARADGASGALVNLSGADRSFQAESRARVSKTGPPKAEGDCRVHPEVSLPSSRELFKPPLDMRSLAKCSPNREPLLPKNNRASKMRQSTVLLLPGTRTGGPLQEPSELEAFGSPLAQLAPDLALRGAGVLPPAAIPSCGTSHKDVPQGYSVSRAGQPERAGLPHSGVGDIGLKGNEESVPVGASPGPACVPHTSPGRKPQDPATSPLRQLQLLVARAAGSEEGADTQSPRHNESSDLEGDSVEGGDLAYSPTQDVPTAARGQLEPEADGHLDSVSQAEMLKGQGRVTVSVKAEAALAKLAGDADRLGGQLQANGVVLGLQKEAWATPSPASSDAESLVPALVVAHVQNGPEGQTAEGAASPGLEKQLLLAGESPAPPIRGPTTGTRSPTFAASPIPCGPEHLPQEDPSGELRGLLPAPSPCRDPSSLQLPPAPSPAWQPPQRANCAPASTETGAMRPLSAPPSPKTSPSGFKGSLAHHPLLGDHRPLEDPPSGQTGFISIFTPAHGEDRPEGSTSGPLEGSRKEKPRRLPASTTHSPPLRASSPRVTMGATTLPDMSATDDMGAARGPNVDPPDRRCRGAPPNASPNRLPMGSASSDLSGSRKGQGVIAVPTDPSTWGTPGPGSYACPEGMAGAGRSGAMKATGAASRAPAATCPSTELRRGRATSPGSTASVSRPSNLRTAHHTPQRDPISPQGTPQKPMSPGNAPQDQAPSRRLMTCDVCAASFRSGPGLSRHKARKHGPRQGATTQPSPPDPPAPRPRACHTPGKKRRRVPGKEKLRQEPSGPRRALRTPPDQATEAPEDALGPQKAQGLGVGDTQGCYRRGDPRPPGPGEPGVDRPPVEPRKQGRLVRDKRGPKQAEKGRGQRRGRAPTDVPSKSEGKSQEKVRKPRPRRFQQASGPPVCLGEISDRNHWDPSTAMASPPGPLGSHLSTGAELDADATRPRVMENTGGTDAKETPAQRSPRDWMACPEGMEWVPPGDGSRGQNTASPRGCCGPRKTSMSDISEEPSRTARAEPAGTSRAGESESGQGAQEGHGPPSHPPGPHETCSSGGTSSSYPQGPLQDPEAQAGVQEQEGTGPDAPGPSLGNPLSMFDDEASFSQLFPLGDRLTRKKNPRVYGKRCKKPKAPPPLELHGKVEGSMVLASARLPTDLSDSGSLCLSLKDPWGDEATGLPESFLLEGFLSSKVPGIDPWAPSPSLWALEPNPEADCTEDHRSENIPELHMVPASWRDLELQAPAEEMASSLGDVSPEPPDLEQERYDSGLPRNAVDLEILSAKLEMQDLCFLGPCDDPVGVPSTSFLDFGAAVTSRGPQSKRPQDARRAREEPGRDRHTKARRASYKCKVCFQRFRGLGELDLHKLAHSPSPPPTCYMCVERRFGSRELLREHLQEKHVQSKAGRWACGMCLREVTDVWMYNEHLREHALQFARKGQARRSLGHWEGDRTVTHFLGSIMGHASRPSGDKRSTGKSNGGPVEALGQQTGAGKEFQRERVKPKAPANTSNPDATLTPGGALAASSPMACGNPTLPSGSTKMPPSLSPEPCPGSEQLLQSIPMHEGCKDPSRDCHHCGKRFPKPFKLQRHLAVHSPQRVYLCPQCPRVYSEHSELRAHLGEAHGVREELELPHTPLYACELCANVTHISRRSFVCSSCNYTFAKKEQFDRHMDKHLRKGQQPFTFRGVRRPGAPGQKAPTREGTLPSKRRRVAAPSSPPRPGANGPLSWGSSPTQSEGSLPGLLQPCPEAAPGATKGQPRTPEKPLDPVGHLVTGGDVPSDLQELLPPALSPFPAASADGQGGCKPDGALGRSEGEASPGSPGPLLQQALPLGGAVPRPGARGQDVEEKRATGPFSGKRRTPSAPGRCAPDHCLEAPSLLQKEKQVSTCHMVPEGGPGAPSHKGSAIKHWGCRSSSKDGSVLSTSSKAPRFPLQPKKAVASPTPRELVHGTEDRPKPTTLKAKPSPSSQGGGGPRHSTKIGGSQAQPASGQLQSETATTPAKPNCPSQGSAPDKHPPRAKGSPKGPKEAGDQEPRGNLGMRENEEVSEKKRKGRAPGSSRIESVGGLGRAHLVPDKHHRAPRKQATPSRVLPTKARPGSQNGTMPPQPSGPGHAHGDCRRGKEGQGKFCPQGRPLQKPSKRDRAVHSAEPAHSRACRTAASQSDLLSQLFGQKLTSFKIPLRKDPPE